MLFRKINQGQNPLGKYSIFFHITPLSRKTKADTKDKHNTAILLKLEVDEWINLTSKNEWTRKNSYVV